MKVAATTANKQNQSIAVANNVSQQKNNSRDDSGFVDNRPETKALKSLQMMINDSPRMAAQRQRISNITGGKAQVIKGPGTHVPNGPAESSKFIRLYAPSPVTDNDICQKREIIQKKEEQRSKSEVLEGVWASQDFITMEKISGLWDLWQIGTYDQSKYRVPAYPHPDHGGNLVIDGDGHHRTFFNCGKELITYFDVEETGTFEPEKKFKNLFEENSEKMEQAKQKSASENPQFWKDGERKA